MKKLMFLSLIILLPFFIFVGNSEARMYQPQTGRFMEPDLIGQTDEDINLYAYTRNNSINLIDPFGLDPAGPYPGSTNPVTKCHVCPHNDPEENAIGGSIISAPLVGMTIPEIIKALLNPSTGLALAEILQNEAGGINCGRTGKQARLRELANDLKISSADRGWIKQEINAIENGKRGLIRLPPDKQLAHRRGFEARKGFDYNHSDLQGIDIHKLQHGIEGYK
jgi:hypothetical protein